ncbi:MAG TPA: ATP-binding protein [Nocardioidaceae bacterium]|nr:ATP-binding protein [Nocardioidaceae bacterium]
MLDKSPSASLSALRVRFAADPASVPGARRFVADGLTSWGRTTLLDDATLCVSELAANAALHSASTYMEIALLALDDAVRISVEDDGVTPAEAVVPRPDFPAADCADDLDLDDEPTTGRGLAIVSILASDWGVEKLEHGKRIWAELTEAAGEHGVRPPRTSTENGSEMPAADPAAALPEGWTVVRLPGCPVELGLRQDQHLDELIRELQLISADEHDLASQQLAAELQGLLSGPAHARHMGRRLSQDAAAAGKTHIDVEMAMPREFSQDVLKLQQAVAAADALCEERRLLTLASSEDLRSLRAWMTESVFGQVERGEEPVSYDDWLRSNR